MPHLQIYYHDYHYNNYCIAQIIDEENIDKTEEF